MTIKITPIAGPIAAFQADFVALAYKLDQNSPESQDGNKTDKCKHLEPPQNGPRKVTASASTGGSHPGSPNRSIAAFAMEREFG